MRGTDTAPSSPITCADCAKEIEVCVFCEESACAHPTCYRCMIHALGQAVAQPHAHGG